MCHPVLPGPPAKTPHEATVHALRLCLAHLDHVPEDRRPSPDPREISVGIVHLGLGAFHRAHQAVYTQDALATGTANSWGICGVTQRSPAVAESLLPQDCLYSVLERSERSTVIRVIGAVRQVLFAAEQAEELADLLSVPSTHIVTLTVTEKGYRFDPSTRRLRRDDPELLADAAGRPPRTVLGQLVGGLEERRQRGGPPLTVVCCDNFPRNGATLRQLVNDFCHLRTGPRAAQLRSWVTENVAFPDTMVDRIVPAATAEDRDLALGLLGLEDRGVVVTEPFCQWVIEDHFAGPRPAWERVGATVVADVAPYEEMKLRLLNGSHSALAYLGALAGFEFISDVVRAPDFARYARGLMDIDVTPTLNVPSGFDLDAYKNDLMGRFSNPVLRHRTTQIAMDGSQKLPYRLLGTISSRLAAGQLPRHACLAVAGWIRYASAGRTDSGALLPLDDPIAAKLRAAARSAASADARVTSFLALREIFPAELAEDSAFRLLLTEAVGSLERFGAAAVVASLGD
jgi:fructuronate reductase